jgi:hypothetical protein
MAIDPRDIWFPAKRFGWGWGLPRVWTGSMVYAAYVALTVVGWIWLPQNRPVGPFLLYIGPITVALLGTCFWKGARPAWRYGK